MMKAAKGNEILEGDTENFNSAEEIKKNWRVISISLIVILLMCLIIFVCVLLFTPLTKAEHETSQPVEINDVLSQSMHPHMDTILWLDDNRLLYATFDNNLTVYDLNFTPYKVTSFVKPEILKRYSWVQMQSCGKNDQLLVSVQDALHSRENVLKILDPVEEVYKNLGNNIGIVKDKISFAWGPLEDQFAVVQENDIYVKFPGNKDLIRITETPEIEKKYIYNGITDWLYFEEIFQASKTMWWAKSGEYLAFLTLNNTEVDESSIPLYQRQINPSFDHVFYPKVGAPNLPIPTLFIYSKKERKAREMRLILKDPSLHTYLFSASWHTFHSKDTLIAVWANRLQNIVTITMCTYDSGLCVLNYEQKYVIGKRKLYGEPADLAISFSTNDAYFVIMPQKKSNGNIFSQVAKISVPENLKFGHESFLPQDNYDVIKIQGYDQHKNLLFFIAAAPTPAQRHTFSVSTLTGSFIKQENAKCVTCNVLPECSFQESEMSGNAKNIFIYCKGKGIPRTFVSTLENLNATTNTVEDTTNLENFYKSKNMPIIHNEDIVLSSGYIANVQMLIPRGYDLDSKTDRLPAVLDVYGGSGLQKVTDSLVALIGLSMSLASKNEYIMIFVDGRGGMYRGWDIKEPTYQNLGTYEVDDTIETMKILTEKYSLIDRTRRGIWGWSYGGFLTAKAIQKDNDHIFKCAASVAPVTNFLYYDATYTERYMGPADGKGYIETDLTTANLSNFEKTRFLLAHGSADDNVHLQNTMNFVTNLVSQKIDFDMQIYPDVKHNMGSSRRHLLMKIAHFFDKCFEPPTN